MSNEEKVGTPVARLQLDISVDDWDFLYRLAKYRNVLAKVQGIRLKQQNSRKSIGEDFIAIKCQDTREKLSAMTDACGPLPPADAEPEDVERYARKVLAWEKKHGG